jgi:thiamine-phosphate pyrophosphorylase
MNPRSKHVPAPRLYLLTPPVSGVAAARDLARDIGDALRGVDIAAVLLRLADADHETLIAAVKATASTVQDGGAALLVDRRAEIVAPAGADGAHLAGTDALRAALPRLKPHYIAGAGLLASRHDAMIAGEAGADYVMFGEPDESGDRPSLEAITDRVSWWAEVFEIPCVAYAARLDEIDALVTAGADFIAVDDAVFGDARGLTAAVADAASRLAVTEPAA